MVAEAGKRDERCDAAETALRLLPSLGTVRSNPPPPLPGRSRLRKEASFPRFTHDRTISMRTLPAPADVRRLRRAAAARAHAARGGASGALAARPARRGADPEPDAGAALAPQPAPAGRLVARRQPPAAGASPAAFPGAPSYVYIYIYIHISYRNATRVGHLLGREGGSVQ